MEKKKYEVWVGYYNVPGYEPSTEPVLLKEVEAVDFKTACIKHELEDMFARIMDGEEKGDLSPMDYHWHFNPNKVGNNFIGLYYETREEAQTTFPNIQSNEQREQTDETS